MQTAQKRGGWQNARRFASLMMEAVPAARAAVKGDRAHWGLNGSVSFFPVNGGVLVVAEIFGLPGIRRWGGRTKRRVRLSHPQRRRLHRRRGGSLPKHKRAFQPAGGGASLACGGYAAPVRQQRLRLSRVFHQPLHGFGNPGAHRRDPRYTRRFYHPARGQCGDENRLRRYPGDPGDEQTAFFIRHGIILSFPADTRTAADSVPPRN